MGVRKDMGIGRRLSGWWNSRRAPQRANPVVFEPLERRLLLSADCPVVLDVDADNRGQVVVTFDRDLIANSINDSSVRIFSAGADGILDTADDIEENITASYDATNRQLRAIADLPADTRYKFVLDASAIQGSNGSFLDGEFNGAGVPSGDGTEGGDFIVYAKPATELIARFTTPLGTIDVRLFESDTPLTVQNFLNYANRGDWDGTFFHRSVVDFVIQGGGFANVAPGFDGIPTDPGVPNEPGISNLRGTIAVAKLPNNPDSGTNQWFFNLGDNSGNLDNQNGGFTVFGEIVGMDGLDVMDAIAALDTGSFTNIGSAFTDVPLLDGNGGMTEDNTASVSRIAVLMDLDDQPAGQLSTDGSILVTNNAGTISVRLYDLSGTGLPSGDYLQVKFNGRNRISSITLADPFPTQAVGLNISGANHIGKISDKRSSGGDLRFIVTSASVGSIDLRNAITGYNLNGHILEGGLLLNEDIDFDGQNDDPVAILVDTGLVNSIRVRGDVTGSIVAHGGVKSLRVDGTATQADVVLDVDGESNRNAKIRFDRVENTQIDSDQGISSLRAVEWLMPGNSSKLITAPTIKTLKITGDSDRNIDGVLQADITIVGDEDERFGLKTANIQDSIGFVNIDVTGDVGTFKIGNEFSQSSLLVIGDIRQFRVPSVISGAVASSGDVRTVRVERWIGGQLQADTARSLKITGNKKTGVEGDFNAELLITAGAEADNHLRQFQVAGAIDGAVLDIRGNTRKLVAPGGILDSEINTMGDVRTFDVGIVEDTEMTINGEVRTARIDQWVGGAIRIVTIRNLVTGNSREGIAGDVDVENMEAQDVRSMKIGAGGSLIGGRFRYSSVDSITVTGNIEDAQLVFPTNFETDVSLESLRVDGMMMNATLHVVSSVGNISLGAMMQSGVYVGAHETAFGLEDDPASNTFEYQTDRTLDRFEVRGMGDGEDAMVGSYLFAGHLGNATINMPKVRNSNAVFGATVNTIRSFVTRFEDGKVKLGRNSTTPDAVGDYQVRIGYQLPDNA